MLVLYVVKFMIESLKKKLKKSFTLFITVKTFSKLNRNSDKLEIKI